MFVQKGPNSRYVRVPNNVLKKLECALAVYTHTVNMSSIQIAFQTFPSKPLNS